MVDPLVQNKDDITLKLEKMLDCYVDERLNEGYKFLKTTETELHKFIEKHRPYSERLQYFEDRLTDIKNQTEGLAGVIEGLGHLRNVYVEEKEVINLEKTVNQFDGILEGHKKNVAESMIKKINEAELKYKELLLQYEITEVSFRYAIELLMKL